MAKKMFLVFDTETTGLPKEWKDPSKEEFRKDILKGTNKNITNWPRMVQLAWQCHDLEGNFLFSKNHVITPDGYTIPEEVVNVHGISTETAIEKGIPLEKALEDFINDVKESKFIIGHNIGFDINIVLNEFLQKEFLLEEANKALSNNIPLNDLLTHFVNSNEDETVKNKFINNNVNSLNIENIQNELPFWTDLNKVFANATSLCTMRTEGIKEFCNFKKHGKLKFPTLTELHLKLFEVPFKEAHNAAVDVEATTRCFLELIRVDVLGAEHLQMTPEQIEAFKKNNPHVIEAVGIEYESFKQNELSDISIEEEERKLKKAAESIKHNDLIPFVHLHVHTQYSILDGANRTSAIAAKAKKDGMPAVAITDHGGMFGVKEFHVACLKEGVKPIIGVETYVARRGHLIQKDKIDRSGDHLILLAKNEKGYVNLLKLVSIAYTKGMYYKPRIDKELLKEYHEGIIVSSACLGGEISQHIMNGNFDKAEEAILWYKDVFGDDYYLELMRHKTDDQALRQTVWENQIKVNQKLIELGKKLNVKLIATNDAHFTDEEDAEAHDMLVCLSTGRDYNDPSRLRYTKQEWFKTTEEMNQLFADIPEVLENTIEIANKVESFELDHAPIMPDFPLPEGFKDEAEYLIHLTNEGAKKRYGDPVPEEKMERINFELDTIIKMGFPGYFLIVQDFINWAKNNGVLVGPGRGSAAGAAVSYCIGITDVDPIKYDLLFERFLNPDRISMPDVDIDFDDDGRQAVLDYVTNKYGHEKVAHICTFGTMATKSSIKDVARALNLELSEANRLAKLVPEAPKMNFKKAYSQVPELEAEKHSGNELVSKTLQFAEKLEGAVRQTGVHACGILIGKNPLNEHLPVMPTKGEELLTTQYDGRFVENIGLLKMDFLGLKTLSIFKEVIENVKLSKGIDIDLSAIPLEDELTFELFGKGETTAIFQFESPGMKKHLRALKPNRFEDLVAMNALYRPGPMEYIPSFINRKHGREKIEYDHPSMEPYLKDTYGITVYQEQVMLQSRALGGFTRGDSDSLRKAMGKKIIAMMDKLKVKFIDGCLASDEFMKGCKEKNKDAKELIEKIWSDWEAFASYAFNKSHSVCYAYVAYQTGYLKAHYPAEFMAGVLSRNLNDITKITTLMEECERMQLDVLGPDVNESYSKFTVNKKGALRFGMAGVKGIGEAAVKEIINEREKNGPYKDIYDFTERVNLQTVNKKNFEALAYSGGFDGFGIKRAQYFATVKGKNITFIEELLHYGNLFQNDKAMASNSIFGFDNTSALISKPEPSVCEEMSIIELCNHEKELIGLYLTAHPLDVYKFEINHLCNLKLREFNNLEKILNRNFKVGGMISNIREGIDKKGNKYAIVTLQDYTDTFEFTFFSRQYPKFANYFIMGAYIMISGKVQEREWAKDGSIEVFVKKIDMLEGMRDNMINNININIPVQAIDDELITELHNTMMESKGNVSVYFTIFNKDKKNHIVNLFSRVARIELTDEIIKYLDAHPEISYSAS